MKKLTNIVAHTSCVLGGGILGGFVGNCISNLQEYRLIKSTESIYEINECCGAMSEVVYSMIIYPMVYPTLISLGSIGGATAGGLGYYFLKRYLNQKNENNLLS